MREFRKPAADSRMPWVKPTYAKLRAGEAELGPNPVLDDGSFSKS